MVPRLAAGALKQRRCPGCGLAMPVNRWAAYEGHYHTSPECWSIYAEVLGREYNDPVLLGGVHSLTVDAYAVHHAGGGQPDESVGVHLAGLYLVLERGVSPGSIPLIQGRLAERVGRWPHFSLPSARPRRTIFDVAVCRANDEYMRTVRAWASEVWDAWSEHRPRIARLVKRHVPLPAPFSRPDPSFGEAGPAIAGD